MSKNKPLVEARINAERPRGVIGQDVSLLSLIRNNESKYNEITQLETP